MPLQKLQFKPGVNRDNTTLAGEGGWFACDKIRFRSGYPQKLGGWVKDTGALASSLKPTTGLFWGTARALHSWQNLSGYNLLGIGTDLKYYIQTSADGALEDITPLRSTSAPGAVTFTTTDTSTTVRVNHVGHGASVGDFVTYSGATAVGGIAAGLLNREFRVVDVPNNNEYTITVDAAATSSGTGGGAATVAKYQVSVTAETFTIGLGWGAGGWSGVTPGFPDTGWGDVAASVAVGVSLQLRPWSQSNYGEDLIINRRGGPLYYWKNNPNPTLVDRAVVLSAGSPAPFDTDSACPQLCNYILVSDASRFVLAFGVNDYGSTVLDPLLVRWSDQENYGLWQPAITNQAGSYRLSQGSEILCAHQTRQEVLVFTDVAVYGMQYQGPPYVWGFQSLGTGVSIAGPNAAVTASDVTYWMGTDAFYVYNGRVQQLRCDLRQYVFGDINRDQYFQVFAGAVAAYSEVWWFYCSANSNAVDRYVVYNYREDIWYYGTLNRTAWLDAGVRGRPVATGTDGQLYYHEQGNDDGSTNPPSPINAFIESNDFDIGDGHNFGFVSRILPDVTFDNSNTAVPAVMFSVRPRRNAGANYGPEATPAVNSVNNYAIAQTYSVQQFTQQLNVRLRGRQMALRVESNTTGVMWQLGAPRIDLRPDGRR